MRLLSQPSLFAQSLNSTQSLPPIFRWTAFLTISLDTVLVPLPSEVAMLRSDILAFRPCSIARLSVIVSLIYFCSFIFASLSQGA